MLADVDGRLHRDLVELVAQGAYDHDATYPGTGR